MVKNFTDEEFKNYALDLGILGATTTYAPPITYGVTAGYYFLEGLHRDEPYLAARDGFHPGAPQR